MRTHSSVWPLFLALAGCTVTGSIGCSASTGNSDESDEAIGAAEASAVLEIHPMDIWAQPLPDGEMKLAVTRDGHKIASATKGSPSIFIKKAGKYAIHLEAPNHLPLDMSFDFDGSPSANAATFDAAEAKGHGLAIAHGKKDAAGKSVTAHQIYIGLRHKWFSAEGRPARRGNALTFLMDGEEAWGTVHGDLAKAQDNVMASTWWWESDFELVRSKEIGATPDERWPNTILGTLEASPAQKRVLIGEFVSQDSILGLATDDSKIRAYANAPNDRFEMMQQANPTTGKFNFHVSDFSFGARVKNADGSTPTFDVNTAVKSTVPSHDVDLSQMPLFLGSIDLASIHQKFMVVDDEVAYIGGMNLRHVDWDSHEHQPYDWRREKFGAWDSTRNKVKAKDRKPDTGPRKDYMVRVDGPSAQDAADIFHERWEYLRGKGVKYAENNTGFNVKRDIAPRDGGIQLQVTATLPEPWHEHAIAETWFNAVRNAEKFIYIEDQYFRMPMINDAIAARMDEKPELKLIVVTMDVGTWVADCVQTYKAHEFFKNRYNGSRYQLLHFKSFDADTKEFVDIDTHSKMLIVDDQFMSVGSANKNNRGIIYEAELNVAVADPIVGEWRKRIFANFLPAGTAASDDANELFQQIKDAAAGNDAAEASKSAPQGFVHTLDFPKPSACHLQKVGPDDT